jgi:hypothetical protein
VQARFFSVVVFGRLKSRQVRAQGARAVIEAFVRLVFGCELCGSGERDDALGTACR